MCVLWFLPKSYKPKCVLVDVSIAVWAPKVSFYLSIYNSIDISWMLKNLVSHIKTLHHSTEFCFSCEGMSLSINHEYADSRVKRQSDDDNKAASCVAVCYALRPNSGHKLATISWKVLHPQATYPFPSPSNPEQDVLLSVGPEQCGGTSFVLLWLVLLANWCNSLR